MNKTRYKELISDMDLELTDEEFLEGWHFYQDFDLDLIFVKYGCCQWCSFDKTKVEHKL